MPEIRTIDDIQNEDGNDEVVDDGEARIYEIGFHIVPSLPEEDIKKEFDEIKKMIEATKESEIISEGLPSLRNLSYSLSKTVKAVKTTYSKAYFGWIKFSALPDQVGEVKKAMDDMATVIRYLIISTVRENTLVTKPESADESEGEDTTDAPEEKANLHEIPADIDRTIDELVVS